MCIKEVSVRNDECKFDRRAPLGVLVLALVLGVVEVYVYALLPPLPLEGEERERGEGGEVKTGQGVDKSWVEVDPNPNDNGTTSLPFSDRHNPNEAPRLPSPSHGDVACCVRKYFNFVGYGRCEVN